MAITINTNLNALRARRRLEESGFARSQSFERLSSGQRILHASDDAAGLSVAASLNVKSRINSQALRNINDAMSYLNIADGATQELRNVLFRLRELSTQAATGSLSNTQRGALNREAQALQAEYSRIIETASFNGVQVLSGAALKVQVGVGDAAVLSVGPERTGLVGDGTFHLAGTFVTNDGPNSIAIADFNGDGRYDLVTSDVFDRATIFLGNGDGTFQAKQQYLTGPDPADVVVADFNGDGVMDVATADRLGGSGGGVSVFIGRGDGTFDPRISVTAGLNPVSLASSDFNGDGIADLVTGDSVGNTMSILLGNGNGTFAAPQSFVTGTSPRSVTTSDFNGDGIIDIVSADSTTATVTVLLGNGDGTFSARRSFSATNGSREVIVADFNRDGIPDLASTGVNSFFIGVLLGNGDGTFQARISLSGQTNNHSLATADFDGDQILDLVSIDFGSTVLSIYSGNGDGTFKARTLQTIPGGAQRVRAGDLNGDGVVDLAIAHSSLDLMSVLLGNGNWEPMSPLTSLSGISLANRSAALAAQGIIDGALEEVALTSGAIGVGMSRLSIAAAELQTNILETKAAESRILDVDIAEESAKLVLADILQHTAASVLAQAKLLPELALRLLQ